MSEINLNRPARAVPYGNCAGHCCMHTRRRNSSLWIHTTLRITRMAPSISKLLSHVDGFQSAAATPALAALFVALNQRRKRRRQGGPDVRPGDEGEPGLRPGGRGGTRSRVARQPRYNDEAGKQAWLLQPYRTQWYLNYIEKEALVAQEGSVLNKEFRAKFRIPYSMFLDILAKARASGEFSDDLNHKKGGQKPHPLSLKLMAALRRLALGCPVDGLECMCGISDTVLRGFITKWEKWFVNTYYDEWVSIPTGDRLKAAMELFERCGLPGFVSSMDAVHVRYNRCPYSQRAIHTGKEGYPSLVWNFHVGHNREIYYMSPEAFPGARNDKYIVRFDEFQDALRTDPRYTNMEYTIKVAPGESRVVKGVHSLNDGGYHRWLSIMCGVKYPDELDVKAWSKLCESTRKDVECVFGILKKRFIVLNNPFLEYHAQDVTRTTKVCVILHNVLLHFDGGANAGDEASDWTLVDEIEAQNFGIDITQLAESFVHGSQAVDYVEPEYDDGWADKRDALIKHYMVALHEGSVYTLCTAPERAENRAAVMD